MGLTQVSTDGVKNDAITKTKIPANQIEASELADNAVDTNAIANNAVTAGKLASGIQTTINNNADNRVITGSGTANTLNGESSVVIDANSNVGIGTTSPTRPLHITSDEDLTSFTGTTKGAFCISNNDYASGEYSAIDFTYTGSDNPLARIAAKITGGGTLLSFGTSGNYSNGITNEALTINTNGNVGIGTTSPSSALDVNGVVEVNNPSLGTDAKLIVKGNDTNNHDIIALYSNASTRGSFAIRTGTSTSPSFLMGTRGSNETLAFMTDGTERARVTDNGITFNGDTAAANALDDYEEGTFTITEGGGISLTTYVAEYIKIGNMVHIEVGILVASNSNGGGIQFLGLPFTAKNTGDNTGGFHLTSTNSGRNDLFFAIRGGTNIGVGTNQNTAVARSAYSNKQLKFSGSYTAA